MAKHPTEKFMSLITIFKSFLKKDVEVTKPNCKRAQT